MLIRDSTQSCINKNMFKPVGGDGGPRRRRARSHYI